MPKKKVAKSSEAVHLTRKEMSILLRLPNANINIGKRDKVILSTLYASGARTQELCDLTVGNIRFGTTTTKMLWQEVTPLRKFVKLQALTWKPWPVSLQCNQEINFAPNISHEGAGV